MAVKTFYATRDMKHPLYRGRMLTAGEPLELDGPTARLYTQLKAITTVKPKRETAAKAEAPYDPRAETVEDFEQRKAATKAPAKRKAAPRKKAPAKK